MGVARSPRSDLGTHGTVHRRLQVRLLVGIGMGVQIFDESCTGCGIAEERGDHSRKIDGITGGSETDRA